jgi:hypothetical protein
MKYLILAQSEVTARALGAWMELLGEPCLKQDAGRLDDDRVLCGAGFGTLPGGFVSGFRRVSDQLESITRSSSSGGVAVLVDTVQVSDLNAAASPAGWNRLIALLILAFPDVRFVFGVCTGFARDEPKPDTWHARHGLPSLFGPVYSPLFDGTGLRAHVRRITAQHAIVSEDARRHEVAPWIPQRNSWAVAIDDEPMYAYLHAYVAYRHGYRAFAVHSLDLADALLQGNERTCRWHLGEPHLSLEDYYLGFPDKESSVHLAHLGMRTSHWSRLENGTIRHFITSGHGRSQGEANVRENREYRRELRRHHRGGREAAKPVAGMFALWRELGLDRLRFYSESGRLVCGLAPGFVWPPEDGSGNAGQGGGHSAPGLLLLVSEILLARCDARLNSVRTVKDAVAGAVMATSALELLGPKTPTTARDALELKHRFEVLAECQFGGIQYNLQPEQRFGEIRRDMKLLGRWYGVGSRDTAVFNGELTIISRLMRVYRDYEEFDEEEQCRARMRSLQRAIWWRKSRRNPFSWFVLPVRAYIEFLIGSMTRFAAALVVWIFLLSLAFSHFEEQAREHARGQLTGEMAVVADVFLSPSPSGEPSMMTPWTSAQAETAWVVCDEPCQARIVGSIEPALPDFYPLSSAISFFFGVELLESPEKGWVAVSIVAMLAGFIHLGIFISQLYSIVARK